MASPPAPPSLASASASLALAAAPLLALARARPLACAAALLALAALAAAVYLARIAWRMRRAARVFASENAFDTMAPAPAPARAAFPLPRDAAGVTLSVVVPAYNEEKRIDVMMRDMLGYLRARARADAACSWEVLIVDDGSRDGTARLVRERYVAAEAGRVRLCKLARNCGKGGAVRKGMLRARGRFVLFADADGATQASDAALLLERALALAPREGDLCVVAGSRAHLDEEKEAKAQRTAFRAALHEGFDLRVGSARAGRGRVGEREGEVARPHANRHRPPADARSHVLYTCSLARSRAASSACCWAAWAACATRSAASNSSRAPPSRASSRRCTSSECASERAGGTRNGREGKRSQVCESDQASPPYRSHAHAAPPAARPSYSSPQALGL